MNHHHQTTQSPQTKGIVLHAGASYDHLPGLLGMGVNGSNSKLVVQMAGIKPGDKVLDIGCGTGSLTLTAKTAVGATGTVYGIDAATEMIAAAREKAVRAGIEARFEVGLVEKIPYPDATFDVVINRLVMHHLPDDLKRQAMAEILRVLKPGGRFFIADFNPPANPILAHLVLALVGHRMMRTDISGLPAMLREQGFDRVAVERRRSVLLGYVSGRKPG